MKYLNGFNVTRMKKTSFCLKKSRETWIVKNNILRTNLVVLDGINLMLINDIVQDSPRPVVPLFWISKNSLPIRTPSNFPRAGSCKRDLASRRPRADLEFSTPIRNAKSSKSHSLYDNTRITNWLTFKWKTAVDTNKPYHTLRSYFSSVAFSFRSR